MGGCWDLLMTPFPGTAAFLPYPPETKDLGWGLIKVFPEVPPEPWSPTRKPREGW